MRQPSCRPIELPLQCTDHATKRLGGSQEQRVVVAGPVLWLPRGKHLSLLGHSKLLLVGRLPSVDGWSKERAKPHIRLKIETKMRETIAPAFAKVYGAFRSAVSSANHASWIL
jgi:hypothetical protein